MEGLEGWSFAGTSLAEGGCRRALGNGEGTPPSGAAPRLVSAKPTLPASWCSPDRSPRSSQLREFASAAVQPVSTAGVDCSHSRRLSNADGRRSDRGVLVERA